MMTALFEGTSEDIINYLTEHKSDYANMRLKISVAPQDDEEDFALNLPDPPFSVRDEAHLKELLLEAVRSEKKPVRDNDLEEMRADLRRRYLERNGQK